MDAINPIYRGPGPASLHSLVARGGIPRPGLRQGQRPPQPPGKAGRGIHSKHVTRSQNCFASLACRRRMRMACQSLAQPPSACLHLPQQPASPCVPQGTCRCRPQAASQADPTARDPKNSMDPRDSASIQRRWRFRSSRQPGGLVSKSACQQSWHRCMCPWPRRRPGVGSRQRCSCRCGTDLEHRRFSPGQLGARHWPRHRNLQIGRGRGTLAAGKQM